MPKIEKNNSIPVDIEEEKTIPRKTKQMLPWILVVLVLIAAGVFFAMQYQKVQLLNKQVSDLKANPQKATEDQTKDLINKVGALIVLPKDEQPTVATVTDLAALKDQPFFANAEVGDKVLIYTNAKKAILYSEKLNKIKEVAPVNIGNNAATAPVSTPTTKSTTTKQTTPPANNTNK